MSVKDRATELGMRLLNEVMSDPEKAQRLMQAVQTVQEGRERVRHAEQAALHVVGLATQEDVARLGRRLSEVRRRLRQLSKRLDDLAGSARD